MVAAGAPPMEAMKLNVPFGGVGVNAIPVPLSWAVIVTGWFTAVGVVPTLIVAANALTVCVTTGLEVPLR